MVDQTQKVGQGSSLRGITKKLKPGHGKKEKNSRLHSRQRGKIKWDKLD